MIGKWHVKYSNTICLDNIELVVWNWWFEMSSLIFRIVTEFAILYHVLHVSYCLHLSCTILQVEVFRNKRILMKNPICKHINILYLDMNTIKEVYAGIYIILLRWILLSWLISLLAGLAAVRPDCATLTAARF